jgi:hypothetical protein
MPADWVIGEVEGKVLNTQDWVGIFGSWESAHFLWARVFLRFASWLAVGVYKNCSFCKALNLSG